MYFSEEEWTEKGLQNIAILCLLIGLPPTLSLFIWLLHGQYMYSGDEKSSKCMLQNCHGQEIHALFDCKQEEKYEIF